MTYKWVWADGLLELASGFAKGVHHFMLLENAADKLGHNPASYNGGTFSEDPFSGPQFDVCRITWQGEGNPPSADQIKFMIQQKLQRYADREAMIISRVEDMRVTAAIENELREVAEQHMPEGGYGDTCWNPETKTVLWVPADWTSNEEAEAAREAFLAIDGVENVEGDAEQGLPYERDGIHPKKPLRLKEPWVRIAADVEDTEPEYNFSFLKHPHEDLYPPAFGEGDKITPRAAKLLKGHVLDALKDGGYQDADQWVYFTVYGSGISYNWDEDGDFDIQMWVDVNKYNESHTDAPQTSDDLVADVRRIVQPVNFPSFKELGLDDPGKEEATGSMLIQYYPKPGQGTKEENLASKPYACYDLETNEWLYKPKPLTPEFYGEHFLSVMQKAEDIAVQSEALLEELQRNTISWQFWSEMIKENDSSAYRDAMDVAKANAEQEKAGVVNLFEGVFGGRSEAYSPEGEGINDERDLIQKLLEVWGVFQRLKHFARQALPWEEQELPSPDDHAGEGEDKTDTKKDSKNDVSHESHIKLSDWSEIMQNAQWLRDNGMVNITSNGAQHVEGTVQSQETPGQVYQTQFDRALNNQTGQPSEQSITTWNCTCPWGEVSWGRTRQWKKYEGRPCKHTLAMYWTSLTMPVNEDRPENQAQPQMQLFNPQTLMPPSAPGGANTPPAPTTPDTGVTPTAQPPQAAPPAPEPASSNPTPPQPPGPGSPSVAIPGALSKVRPARKIEEKTGAFMNGQVVVIKNPTWGVDRDQGQRMVPAGALGEILWSDDHESIAIFPLDSGILEPHLVRVQTETENLRPSKARTPFVRKR